jgi:uncharacterized protein (TIGR02466 family)
MHIESCFSSPISNDLLESIDNEELVKYCYELKNSSSGRVKSNGFGWQSYDINEDNPQIKNLQNEIFQRVGYLHKEFGFKTPAYHRISNMWVSINNTASFNRPHVHAEALFSGVYYAQTEEDSGDLIFLHPATSHQYHIDERAIEKFTDFNSSVFVIKPQAGKLVLFPSWLVHYVEPNRNNKDRISISFNTYIDLNHKVET